MPVLFPLAEQVGIDPFHFAAVFVLCMGIALLTPPVGLILYMVTDMSGATLVQVIKESITFFGAQLLVLALVSYVPILTTWLPSLAAK